jgi:hypothetical protein
LGPFAGSPEKMKNGNLWPFFGAIAKVLVFDFFMPKTDQYGHGPVVQTL